MTEDGLEYLGVCDASNFDGKIKPFAISVAFKHALAACHSLTKINGELNGDPLELEMLKSTGWVVTEPNENENDSSDNLNFTKIWDLNNGDNERIVSSWLQIGLFYMVQVLPDACLRTILDFLRVSRSLANCRSIFSTMSRRDSSEIPIFV